MGVVLIGMSATGAGAALLTLAERNCELAIATNARTYAYQVGLTVRNAIHNNLTPTSRYCANGRRCVSGAMHGVPCTTNGNCPGGGCYPNFFTGGSPFPARRILARQNTFKINVFTACAGLTPSNLLYPSNLCPDLEPAPGMTFDQVVDCVLRNNASSRPDGIIVDTIFEPYRRALTHLTVPHPADFATYPTTICGVPGSNLFQFGTNNQSEYVGRQGGTRMLFTTSCVGDVCQTQGESATDFAGNMWDDPYQMYVGAIPVCVVTQPQDTGNGTFETGQINLTSGAQTSIQVLTATLYIGQTCPKCNTAPAPGFCSGGVNAGQLCIHRGSEDIACPPSGVGITMTLPLVFSTNTSTMSVPANNPGAGVTNPDGTFCGACDLDDTIGCQNDADCVSAGVCAAGFGNGCCTFGTNTGSTLSTCAGATTVTAEGEAGPFIPHLAALWCMGKTGSALVDSTVGLPGPARFIEPRLNVYAW
jgi:hypothetical protein